MIVKKERKLSLRIQMLQALVRRLDPEQPELPKIKAELARCMAGYKGEESIDYYLDLISEIDCDYFILHDLRLPYKEKYFQIDTLILFPSFFLVLEVKNISGHLIFDPAFQQIIRNHIENGEEKEVSMPCPIEQVQRQIAQLKYWFSLTKQLSVPGECLVIMANEKAPLKAKSHHNLVEKYVVRSSALARKIEEIYRKYSKEIWNKKDLNRISSLLLKGNEPSTSINLFKKYGITISDIKKGVHCPKCSQLAMDRIRGGWRCPHCHFTSKTAHINALKDYCLLISQTITISEFQEFLGIDDETTARRLLKSLQLPYEGKTNRRKYILDFG